MEVVSEAQSYWIWAAVVAVVGVYTAASRPLESVEAANALLGSAMIAMAVQALHHVHLLQNPREKYVKNSNGGENQR